MIISKDSKNLGTIDKEQLTISTKSFPLRRLVSDRLINGIIAGSKGWYDKEQKVFIDTIEKLYPKDGVRFWNALKEELILEGYDIK